MALDDEDIRRLDQRAREVGERIGWQLRFYALGNPEYVALTAGPDQIVIVGPSKLANLGAHDIELELDAPADKL